MDTDKGIGITRGKGGEVDGVKGTNGDGRTFDLGW